MWLCVTTYKNHIKIYILNDVINMKMEIIVCYLFFCIYFVLVVVAVMYFTYTLK